MCYVLFSSVVIIFIGIIFFLSYKSSTGFNSGWKCRGIKYSGFNGCFSPEISSEVFPSWEAMSPSGNPE